MTSVWMKWDVHVIQARTTKATTGTATYLGISLSMGRLIRGDKEDNFHRPILESFKVLFLSKITG
jgi:hypothetical protein